MRSDVIFDSPYLDRCLRFGWYLDIIMLLLLGDVSLMFGPDSVVHMDDRDYPFDDRWLDVTCFFDLSHIWCPIGVYSISDEIYRSSWSCMLISTYEVYTEKRTCSLYYHIPQWSLSWATQPDPYFSTFRCRHTPHSRYVSFDASVRFNCGFGLWRSNTWWWMISCHLISDLPYIRCHTMAYFRFGWDLQIFMELHAHLHLRDTRWDDDLFAILLWSPSRAFLEPSN